MKGFFSNKLYNATSALCWAVLFDLILRLSTSSDTAMLDTTAVQIDIDVCSSTSTWASAGPSSMSSSVLTWSTICSAEMAMRPGPLLANICGADGRGVIGLEGGSGGVEVERVREVLEGVSLPTPAVQMKPEVGVHWS